MVMPNDIPEENPNLEEQKVSDAQLEYEHLATAVPEKPISLSDEDGVEYKTATEQQKSTPKMTDMQIADQRLFPEIAIPYLQRLCVARITPEAFTPLKRLLIRSILQDYSSMTFSEVIATVETAMSIAIDGEGRIDELALVGASQAKEAQKVKDSLGLP